MPFTFTVPNTKPFGDPALSASVRARLAGNPQFLAWQHGVGPAMADPNKFGITDLPKDAWIDKQGNLVTTRTGLPWASFASMVGAPLAMGALGSAAGGGATIPAATAGPSASGGMDVLGSGGAGVSKGFGSGILAKLFGTPGGAALINAATGIVGTRMQAGAVNHAADIQAQSAREALDFLKSEYDTAQTQYKPFLDASTAAMGRMSDQAAHLPDPYHLAGKRAMGGPVDEGRPYLVGERGPEVVVPQGNGTVIPNQGTPMSLLGSGGSRRSGGMVMMRAPNGETAQVQPGSVQKYLAQGAVVV